MERWGARRFQLDKWVSRGPYTPVTRRPVRVYVWSPYLLQRGRDASERKDEARARSGPGARRLRIDGVRGNRHRSELSRFEPDSESGNGRPDHGSIYAVG